MPAAPEAKIRTTRLDAKMVRRNNGGMARVVARNRTWKCGHGPIAKGCERKKKSAFFFFLIDHPENVFLPPFVLRLWGLKRTRPWPPRAQNLLATGSSEIRE